MADLYFSEVTADHTYCMIFPGSPWQCFQVINTNYVVEKLLLANKAIYILALGNLQYHSRKYLHS